MNPLSSPAAGFLLDRYQPPAHAFDELLAGPNVTRPHWRMFLNSLDDLGPHEFTQRWDEVKELLRVNGVTYNLHGDAGLDRPWQLDPIPLLISENEARHLERGLLQRTHLLEAILKDLYGPQRLLKQGLLPPELVFANPAFLRPCHNVKAPQDRYLHLLAADLARDRTGNWLIISHRSQAPSGAGYALENRILLARMLPEVFQRCNIQRLAVFFRSFRDHLRGLAPHNRDNPRIVLLTPGPKSETYFEHAYLARYLGYTLVEGGDLTVRDNRVYLKLLEGLQPVDVILRRVEDALCDPLELKPTSTEGIPGLVQAIRAGHVAVANAIGCGWIESPGLIPFLPGICRALFRDDLILPSVPTHWCGEPTSLDHVLMHLERMVIKPAFPPRRSEPIFCENLTRTQRLDLAARIEAEPFAFVAQEKLDLSTSPVMADNGIEPRALVMRTYLTAHEKSYLVMPGGLTRYTGSAESSIVAVQKGGGSKDTWVLTSETVSTFSLLRPSAGLVELSRGGSDLPSRAADNLLWLGRYAERTEGMVRLLRGIFIRLVERSGLVDSPELPTLLRILTVTSQAFPGFVQDGAEQRLAHPEPELYSLVFDRDRPGSLAFNLHAIYRTASSVRDRISLDMWRIINDYDLSKEKAEDYTLSEILDLLNRHVLIQAGFGGLASESMTRGYGWRFLDMGRKIERAMQLMHLLRGIVQMTSTEASLLEAILEIADSLMTFRRRYLSQLHAAPVLDLLLADETNPRSLVFQLNQLRENIDHLPGKPDQAGRSLEQRVALAMVTTVQLADIEKLAHPEADGHRQHLDEVLAGLETDIPLLCDSISNRFLSHLQVSRHLSGGPG